MQFVTQFSHVLWNFRVWSRKQNKKCLGKTVLKISSQKSTGRTNFVPRIRQRMLMFSWFFIFFLHFFLKVILWSNRPLFHKSETTLSLKFSFNICFGFFTLNSRISKETCVNCLTNCLTAEIYPLEVQILEILFFLVILRTIKNVFLQNWEHIIKTVFSKKKILLLAPKCLETIKNCVTNYLMQKMRWQSDLHGKINHNVCGIYDT